MLEMNYSRNPSTLKTIQEKLLSRPIRDTSLHLPASFVLEDALVVIRTNGLREIKVLYLLDAHRESFRSFNL
jgi:hypothetical protein